MTHSETIEVIKQIQLNAKEYYYRAGIKRSALIDNEDKFSSSGASPWIHRDEILTLAETLKEKEME